MSTETCAYCGKERPVEEMKRGTITYRGFVWDERQHRRKTGLLRKVNWYCADGPCHMHDRFGHEG